MLEGWLAGGLSAERFTVADPGRSAVPEGVRLLNAVPASERFDAILLAVKPQLVEVVAPAVAALADEQTLLLSVLAGTSLAALDRLVPRPVAKVRVMPNLAAAFGRSAIGLAAARPLGFEQRKQVDALMQPLGTAEWLDDEAALHAVTALAGSGPGFVYRFLDALAEGGAGLGLEPATAARMALATVAGAAELAARSGEPFAALAQRVASKGGTTEAGLAVLDRERALADLIARTLEAARDRSRELAGA